MLNCKCDIEDSVLTITIDLEKDFGLSKSKKTIVVANTKGNKEIENTVCVLDLNVYKYPEGE